MTNRVPLEEMTPRQIVGELDKYIIGQDKAKRAVAIALRNRVRRKKLPGELQDEVAPKNIIMIGPTGVGKTEIARRISRISGAPFLKVEATKFTEVGYVGRDVESMIRDLMGVGITMVRQELQEEVREQAARRTEDILLECLVPDPRQARTTRPSHGSGVTAASTGQGSTILGINISQLQNSLMEQLQAAQGGVSSSGETAPAGEDGAVPPADDPESQTLRETREKLRERLRAGRMDDKEIEIMAPAGNPGIEVFPGGGMEDLEMQLGGLGALFGGRKKKKRVTVARAREIFLQEEMQKLLDPDRVNEIARERVQDMGIIFIDEIDKIAARGGKGGSGPDVSREGVQRDILPIVEGCQVSTKYGVIDTRHILFIAAGAFHISSPSDLIPELQGRFPIRVELESLKEEDFYRILVQPANAITRQYQELLRTEEVEVEFTEEALHLMARMAAEVNQQRENIGARRLSTIMEQLLDEVSFHAPEMPGQKVTVTPQYVEERLGAVVKDQDMGRYIL